MIATDRITNAELDEFQALCDTAKRDESYWGGDSAYRVVLDRVRTALPALIAAVRERDAEIECLRKQWDETHCLDGGRSLLSDHGLDCKHWGKPKRDAIGATLETIRSKGWTVAVHNDYRLEGKHCTFWLFTHPGGRWAKGEGNSDCEALDAVLGSIAELEKEAAKRCPVHVLGDPMRRVTFPTKLSALELGDRPMTPDPLPAPQARVTELDADGWQPIKTAPKGVPVLVWRGSVPEVAIFDQSLEWSTYLDESVVIHPKFWRSLPAPPKE